jgi:hypothetical protein
MEIPDSAEILGSSCFGYYQLFSSMSFESNSQLTRIESDSFAVSSFETIVIPFQGYVLGLDAGLACAMSTCARVLPRGVSASESFFALNNFDQQAFSEPSSSW